MEIKNQDTTDARISVLENNYHVVSHNVEKLEYKIDQNYATLHSRVSELRDDLRKDFETKNEKILAKLEEHNIYEQEQNKALQQKIAHIERWRWMIMGGALVIGYILAHVKLENIL
tara:strand:- start:530 stop:877 length:348 start_codon:yes stop_codon:yes gene_type:complete